MTLPTPAMFPHTDAVLFAGLLGRCPTSALQRAAAFASALGAELRVLQTTTAFESPSEDLEGDEIGAAATFAAMLDHALTWCRRELSHAPHSVHVVHGALEDVLRDYTRSYRPDLVVIPPYEASIPGLVTGIVTRSRAPVLVARAPKAGPVIVATALEDASYPVLGSANELLSRDEAVVALHVIDGTVSQRKVETVLQELQSAAGSMSRRSEAIVAPGDEIANVIVGEARARRADLVVVGARRHAGFRLSCTPDVPSSVIRRSRRSILVTPLPDREAWSSYSC